MRRERPDLSAFQELDKKTPFDKRFSLALEVFPSINNLAWDKVFRQDPTILGEIVNDIISYSEAPPKRPGKRPAVEKEKANEHLRRLLGDDYSVDSFADTFRMLAGKRSIRHLATKTGLDRNEIFRLLRGENQPNLYQMEQVAGAFGKTPDFFLEYRINWLIGLINYRLAKVPEVSTVLYRKWKGLG